MIADVVAKGFIRGTGAGVFDRYVGQWQFEVVLERDAAEGADSNEGSRLPRIELARLAAALPADACAIGIRTYMQSAPPIGRAPSARLDGEPGRVRGGSPRIA